MSKTIKFPEPVKFVDPETGDPTREIGPDGQIIPGSQATVEFARFVRQTIMVDERWGQTTEWILSAGIILSALREGQKTGELVLEDEDYQRLAEISKSPQRRVLGVGVLPTYALVYNTLLLPQLAPFFTALGTDKPAKK